MQVVLVLDQREQFGRHVGGRTTASRTESRDECVRQVRNLGINVEVRPQPTLPHSRGLRMEMVGECGLLPVLRTCNI
jgi:hypothetical protein